MNTEQVRALLWRIIQEEYGGSMRQFAQHRDVSVSTVSQFLGKKQDEPGDTLLAALGLEEVKRKREYRKRGNE